MPEHMVIEYVCECGMLIDRSQIALLFLCPAPFQTSAYPTFTWMGCYYFPEVQGRPER